MAERKAPRDLERMLVDETAEPKALPLSLLEDITGDFSHAHEIGRGGFAVVYKGILGGDMAVAVKRLTNDLMDEMEFHREVECLMRVKHKNVVRFLGYCANRQGTMETYDNKLVMADVHQRLLCFEYIPQGSLDKYIIDANREWGTCYRIIKGICEGLQYLHENNIIHLDLKPTNILLGNNMVPKITDFGVSRCFDENQSRHITKTILGTLGYLAPELRSGGIIARSADLYSLGVIIIEILTGEKGYQDIGDVLDSWSDRLERSQQDTLCEQIRACYEIALECIDFSPKKRPASARNIIDRLHEMRSVQNPGFANDVGSRIKKLNQELDSMEGVLVLDSMELDDGPWEATGSNARCTPNHVSNNLESILQNQSSRPHAVPLKHLEEITNNFSEERILGHDGFVVVYKGVLQNGEMIAVKKIVSSLMPGLQKQFENEVSHLMKLNHPNIVRLVGYCCETKNLCVEYNGRYVFAEMVERLLCLEYLPKGSLDRYISDESSGLDWSTCYNIIEGICCGLLYLHVQNDKPIIHLDLKPANILLSDGMVPKIADFGLSRLLDQQQTICTASRDGTIGYMPPEFMVGGKITPKSDIFSLGVIIIEVVTGHRDYPDVTSKMSKDEFINIVLEKWRDVLQRSPGYVSLEMDCEQIKRCLQVGLICLNPDRTKRPPITKVISMLQGSESIDCDISNEATA